MSELPDKIWLHKQSEVATTHEPVGLMSALYQEYTRQSPWVSVDTPPVTHHDTVRAILLIDGVHAQQGWYDVKLKTWHTRNVPNRTDVVAYIPMYDLERLYEPIPPTQEEPDQLMELVGQLLEIVQAVESATSNADARAAVFRADELQIQEKPDD
jgi:hypothetical protein